MNQRRNPITEDELHGYVDGLLGDYRRGEVESLLAHDADVAAQTDAYRRLNTLLRERYDRVLLEPLPLRLQFPSKRRSFAPANLPRFAAMAAALLLSVGVGVGIGAGAGGSIERIGLAGATGSGAARHVADDGLDRFARQSAIAHVMYAPEVERPVGASMDPAHEAELGKWLSGRLGTDTVPPALVRVGYKLMGGRMVRGDDGSFAQFTYNSASGERVTLCISHLAGAAETSAFALYKDGPVKVFHWIAGDYSYSVAGGMKREKLLQVARDVSSAMVAESGAAVAGDGQVGAPRP